MKTMRRRNFLQTLALGGTAAAAGPFVFAQLESKVFRTALIGSGWWGKNILREAIARRRCKIVGLADVDAAVLEVAGDQVNDLSGDTPRGYDDYRELLAKEKPEIVIIATPDHWHALNAVD